MDEQQKGSDRKDRMTVMVIPEGGGSVRRVQLSRGQRSWIKRTLLVLVLLAVGVGAFSVLAASHTREFFRLREQVASQKAYIIQAESKLRDLQASLERIQMFEQKVRIVLGQTPSQPEEDFVGIGGPNRDDLDPLVVPEDRKMVERFSIGLERTAVESSLVEPSIQELHSLLQDQANLLQSTPSIWPVRGWVTSRFGERTSPFTGLRTPHEGMDVATRLGAPIVAPADGVVLFAGILGGYGKSVLIDHGYDVTTRYGHMSEINVKPGQKLRRGDLIGKVGNTGRSTGPHLHYEVRVRSVPVDPQRYLLVE